MSANLGGVSLFDVFGLIGFAAYLIGFAALQFGWIAGESRTYAWANIAGAAFVLVSLTQAFNLASALIQISWIVIGIAGLIRRRRNREPVIGRCLPG